MKTRLVGSFAVLAVLGTGIVLAAEVDANRAANPEDRLYRYWENFIDNHDMGGAVIPGMGRAGATNRHASANLVAGKHYVFTLFCDVNCTNAELRALDGTTAIQGDATSPIKGQGAGRAQAEFAFTAAKAGSVQLEAKINACSAGSCNYAIGQFASH